jgi:hypothetical protein
MTRKELNDLPLQPVEMAQMLPKASSPLVSLLSAQFLAHDFFRFDALEQLQNSNIVL